VRGFRVPLSFWLFARIALGFRGPRTNIIGADLAGEIELVGKDVKNFKRRDQVFAYPGHTGGVMRNTYAYLKIWQWQSNQ
jgi:NADPH:quinone reductase-like Zn-dependent oxidoreductase